MAKAKTTKRTMPKAVLPSPSLQLLVKLGSAIVHAEEFLSPTGHPVDRDAFNSVMADPEVRQWIADMGVFLPLKRVNREK